MIAVKMFIDPFFNDNYKNVIIILINSLMLTQIIPQIRLNDEQPIARILISISHKK